MPLGGGSRVQEGRGAHQIVCNDTEPDPASGAVRAMIPTASQAMPSLEHTDTAFAADAPALSAAKPPLSLIGAPRRGFPTGPRQHDAADAARQRRVFILGRGEAAVRRREIRRAAEDRHVPIERGCPQRHISGSCRVDFVRRDDLMLGFLNCHELAEFCGLRNFAFPDRLRCAAQRR